MRTGSSSSTGAGWSKWASTASWSQTRPGSTESCTTSSFARNAGFPSDTPRQSEHPRSRPPRSLRADDSRRHVGLLLGVSLFGGDGLRHSHLVVAARHGEMGCVSPDGTRPPVSPLSCRRAPCHRVLGGSTGFFWPHPPPGCHLSFLAATIPR